MLCLMVVAAASSVAEPTLDVHRLSRLLFSDARPPTRPPVEADAFQPTVTLHGTLVSADPAWSRAVISDAGATRVRLVAEGEQLDGLPVVSIARGHVWLQRGPSLVRLEIAFKPAGPPKPRAPEWIGTYARFKRPGVVQVNRAAVLRDFGSLSEQLAKGARVLPRMTPDGVRGFSLSFAAGSPLAAFGLESGDVLIAIDGDPLTPQRGLALLQQLPTARGLTLELERQGVRRTLRLEAEE